MTATVEPMELAEAWHAPDCTADAGGACILDLELKEAWVAGYEAQRAEIERLTQAEGAFLAEVARLRAALVEISELELEGDASLDDAIHLADEVLNP